MYWAEFLTVALIHLLAVASPGPDFAVVVRESVTHGRKAGTWAALGVGSAIFLHVGYSLLGIGIIVSQSIVLFNALKWAAAAYLLYIGIKALRAKPAAATGDTAIKATPGERTARGAYISGFVTNGLNPKATLFFLSLFTVVINPHTPLLVQG
ncbi:LysE family translocator, partial [Pseudomonas syringae]